MKKIFEAIPGGDLRPRLDELRDDVEVSAAAGRVQRRVVPAVVAAEQLGPARGTQQRRHAGRVVVLGSCKCYSVWRECC